MMMEDRWLCLEDANGRERDWPRPWLVFDAIGGTFAIADDFETSNDDAQRDFILHKNDAVQLALALLKYALYGTTSEQECISQFDVERSLEEKSRKQKAHYKTRSGA